MALHAAVLGFAHPVTGRPLRFEAPLPRELAAFLEAPAAAEPGAAEPGTAEQSAAPRRRTRPPRRD
jgi:hypothetical protein